MIIVGSGDQRKDLENKAKNLDTQIIFKGYIPHEKIHKTFQKSDFYIQLSEAEGMSNTIMEAMASGCVPIVNKKGGMKNIINHGESGFIIENKNIPDIELLIEETDKIKQNARQKIKQDHSVKKLKKNYIKAYNC